MPLPFYLVDVFAETKYAGNQLAVIRNAAELSDIEMQSLAREMNYSETTFISSDLERDGGYDVRIFSLDEELPFAGHPTLGTAYVIQQELIKKPLETVVLNLEVGPIPVSFSYDHGLPGELWMRQIEPAFGKTLNKKEVAAVLNLDPVLIDQSFPVEEVSTGLPFIIVPLASLEAVRSCRLDSKLYEDLIKNIEAKSILVFCPEAYNPGNNVNARMFDLYHGIAEDPATGSANGCLAAYLVKNRYYGKNEIAIRVEQGYEIGRPSLLLLQAKENEEGAIIVNVGGRVIMVGKGELY